MRTLFKNILNLLLPPRCVKCGEILSEDDGLCAECFNEINFISAPSCQKCGQPFFELQDSKVLICGECMNHKRPHFRLSRSALEYNEKSKNLILSFKFMDKTESAKVLAKWLNLAVKDIIKEGADVLVPVPLHYSRLLKRKYNQSALLAKELGKLTGLEVDYLSLKRSRKTKPQVQFSGKARIKNVKDAFCVKNNKNILGKRVVLIDDVMTTGSTLKESALALKKAGAKSVDLLTVARVCR